MADLLEFFPTNSLSWNQLEYNGGSLLNLHYGLIHNGLPTQVNLNESELPSIKDDFKPKKFTLCEKGDLAFADASEDTNDVGKVIEFVDCSGKEIVCGLHTIHGRDKFHKTIPGFKGYAFSSKAFHDQIKCIAQGTKIFSISTRNFEEVSIGIPTSAEQIKLASFLSLIDKRIIIQNKVIEDLKKLKTALCESLYDESDPDHLLGELIEQITIRNRNGENLKILSVSNQLGFIEQSEQFDGRTIASQDTSNYKIVSLDDFAFNPARINVGSIARLKDFEKGIVSPMYVCFHCKNGILPGYLESFFDTDYFFLEMEKRLEGSVRMCLSYEGLCNIPIAIPDFLRQKSVERKIQVLKDKIMLEESAYKQLSLQKQFLLSQLFI